MRTIQCANVEYPIEYAKFEQSMKLKYSTEPDIGGGLQKRVKKCDAKHFNESN